MSVAYKLILKSNINQPLMHCVTEALPRIGEKVMLPPTYKLDHLKVVDIIYPVRDILSKDFSTNETILVYVEEINSSFERN